jgi:tetratricopeptide (TPR) repeat protein
MSALALAGALAVPAFALSEEAAVKKMNTAIDALQKGDATTAVPLLTEVIDSGKVKGKNLQIAYFARGSGYAMLDQCPNAIPDFTKSLEMKPDDPQVLAQRGNCYSKTSQPQLAVADMKAAVAVEPTNKDYAEFYCAVAFNAKAHADAGAACEAAVTKFPLAAGATADQTTARNQMTQASAQSYEEAGDKPSSLRMWTMLLSFDPTSEAAKQGIERTGGGKPKRK